MVYENKPWLKIYTRDRFITTLAPYPEMPLFKFLDDTAAKWPDRPAITFLDRKMNFSQLQTEADSLANALAGLGVKKGDLVATILPNSPQFVIADYALLKCGAANVPCSLLHTARELEYELNEAKVETAILLDSQLPLINQVKPKTRLKNLIITSLHDYTERQVPPDSIPGTYQFRQLIAEADPVPPKISINPREDLAEVPFTGGATGIPKGVMLTHYNMTSNVLQLWEVIRRSDLGFLIEGYGSMLLALPFFHQYGHWAMHSSIFMAANMLLVPDPRDADMMSSLLRKYRPIFNIAVPTQFMKLLQKVDQNIGVMSASGSAALPPELAEKYEKKSGAPLDEGFGLTECSPVTHINLTGLTSMFKTGKGKPLVPPQWIFSFLRLVQRLVGGERLLMGFNRIVPLMTRRAKARNERLAKQGIILRKKGSIGVPAVDTEVRIVDERGEDVLIGAPGEMWIKGPQVMKGYWPEPGKGLKDGWLATGDIARMEDDGFFYIVDRIKDMINVSGNKVYSRVVDDVLYQIPGVEMACAIGLPDPDRPGSERVKVFIKCRPEFTGKITVQQVLDHCRTNLPAYAYPKFVEFRDNLPLTATEKIFKRKLREEEILKSKRA